MCAENAFGILVTRLRIIEKMLGEDRQNAEEVLKALCVLHNCLLEERAALLAMLALLTQSAKDKVASGANSLHSRPCRGLAHGHVTLLRRRVM